MTDSFTPVMRALVAATLLLATATRMLVAVNTARAAGARAIGACGAFGEAHDFGTIDDARKSALAKCQSDTCRVVPVTKRGCAAFALDFTNACGAHGSHEVPAREARTWHRTPRTELLFFRCQYIAARPRHSVTYFTDRKSTRLN